MKGVQASLKQTRVVLWIRLGAATQDLAQGSVMVLAPGSPWTRQLQ